MVLLFFAWLLLGSCSYIIGNAILDKIDNERVFGRAGDRLIASVWLGVLILGAIFMGLSVVMPLTPLAAISAGGSAVGVSLLMRQNRASLLQTVRQFSLKSASGAVILALGAGGYASQIMFWFDTSLYHHQMIKWLSLYGSVPGLALIHKRFAFTSSWFATAAPFNHGILDGRVSSLMGGFALLMLLFGSIMAAERAINGRARIEDWFLLTASSLSALPVVLMGVAISPSPDLPIIILPVIVTWTILIISNKPSPHPEKAINVKMIPLILSAGALTVKLSALPLIAVSGFFFIFGGRFDAKKTLAAAAVTALFTAPFMAAAIATSGCPLYPLPFLCTDLPWSLGAGDALSMAREIREWARWGGRTPEGATSINWIIPWIMSDKISALLILSSAASLAVLILKPWEKISMKNYYAAAAGTIGTAFVFYSAPGLRFGLGYFIILPALLSAYCLKTCDRKPQYLKNASAYLNFFTLSVLAALLLTGRTYLFPRYYYAILYKAAEEKRITTGRSVKLNPVLPPRHLNLSLSLESGSTRVAGIEDLYFAEKKTGDLTYYVPEKDVLCWNGPLPCAPTNIVNVRLRKPGLGLAGGFVKTDR